MLILTLDTGYSHHFHIESVFFSSRFETTTHSGYLIFYKKSTNRLTAETLTLVQLRLLWFMSRSTFPSLCES